MHPTRQRLLDHGLQIAKAKGLRGLTVRDLAAAAQVNLGSFVYHFGNRDAFLQELVELWYAPLYAQLQVLAQPRPDRDPLQRLLQTLQEWLSWVYEHADIVAHLVADAIAGETSVREFARHLPDRHPRLFLRLVTEAQAQGQLVNAPPLQLMLFLFSATGMPVMLTGLIPPDTSWMPQLQWVRQGLRDPAAVRARLQWAIRGISTSPVLAKV